MLAVTSTWEPAGTPVKRKVPSASVFAVKGVSAETLPSVSFTEAPASGSMRVFNTWPETVPLGVAGTYTMVSGPCGPASTGSGLVEVSGVQPITRRGSTTAQCFFIFFTLTTAGGGDPALAEGPTVIRRGRFRQGTPGGREAERLRGRLEAHERRE